MKRKLALLLAAVMTLSAAPMNLFASTTNRLSVSDIAVPDYTLFYEPSKNVGAGDVENHSDIEYYTNGSYLIITADNASSIKDGASFDLTLENADWAYIINEVSSSAGSNTDTKTVAGNRVSPETTTVYKDSGNVDSNGDPIYEAVTTKYTTKTALEDAVKEAGINAGLNTVVLGDTYVNVIGSGLEDWATFIASADFAAVVDPALFVKKADGTFEALAASHGLFDTDKIKVNSYVISGLETVTTGTTLSTKNLNNATTASGDKLIDDALLKNTLNTTEGRAVDKNGTKVYQRHNGQYNLPKVNGAAANEVPYEINFYSSAKRIEVTVDFSINGYSGNGDYVEQGDAIVIPLAILGTESGEDISLRISNVSNDSSISTSGKFNVATSSGGYTTTYVQGSLKRGSDSISSIEVTIGENKIGSIADGSFRLTAPSGYEFNDPAKWKFSFESGLSDDANTDAKVKRNYRTTGSSKKENLNQVEVEFKGINRSTDRLGIVVISNIELIAEDETKLPASSETLKAEIRNTGSADIVTNEKFDIAIAANYTLVLSKVTNNTPELVSGRLEEDAQTDKLGSTYTPGDIDDDYHKVDKIQLRENVGDSWWSTSGTTLVLPEGVRFLAVEFDELANIQSDVAISTSKQYANAHRREDSFITINDNVLTLNNLKTDKTTARTKLQMDIWVNLEVDFEGDIDVTLTNYSVRTGENSDQSVTVGTAIVPVVVETTVSDVKIGLQYVSVADFDVTETKAGNLLQGKEVYITVSDEISTDMYLAPGFAYEVSEGNLKISNVTTKSTLTANKGVGTVNNDAQLKFEIDRESTVASTISFSNVQVKIGRDVPYSNVSTNEDRGINLIVWGDAIAENYEGLWNTSDADVSSYDFFSTPGIRAKYINVISKDTTNSTNFTNVVKVTIGNPVVLINGEEYTMPVAAYVSTASNSTMVPLRFVAYALGLDEEAVTWDIPTSTATINAGTRMVQFTSGSNYYVVNGVQVGMTSPDGLPVSAEISEERIFIPFRQLGNAFDIPVSWDGPTSTATYNDPSAL